ncbi:MAG: biotin/lipoyl-binding protein [Candidimonas sp.]|nr:MAG: biotin/lipoyl-binding protein [Candidimonas sp.]TAM21695.1 MAG: biotin/lipoyl-binding protein [Candidimonas sp.]TAM77645.1 MAG: biotin/lipoyl-binding protein [Candidimonas sp.]
MSNKSLTYQDLVQIIDLIKSSSHFDEFHLKTGELEVDIKRNASGSAPCSTVKEILIAPEKNDSSRQAKSDPPTHPDQHPHITSPAATQPLQNTRNETDPTLDIPVDAILIKSPMVGTFYRASEPGAAPFVEIGQQTEASTIVCLIEVMKLINSIAAEQRGIVTHIFVKDGEPVEYGQVLMALASSA